MTTIAAALRRTRLEVGRATAQARRGWGPLASLCLAAYVLAAALPLVVSGPIRLAALASGLLLALAAAGAGLAIGYAGIASLAQGAFMATGAFGTALLQLRAGWSPLLALAGSIAAAALCGLVAGAGVIRLPGAVVAATTWLVAWLAAVVLGAFPQVSGGAQGLVLPPLDVLGYVPGPGSFYELALALMGLSVLALWALGRSGTGLSLAALREEPRQAAALGVPGGRLRLGAFVVSAAVGSLAGGLAVQLDGVADASAYGPFLSFQLFVAVLLGGAAVAAGGPVGVGVLAVLGLAWEVLAAAIPGAGDVPSERADPMIASLLLLAVLAYGGEGLLPALAGRRRRPVPGPGSAPPLPEPSLPAADEPLLRCRALRRSFGAVSALAGLDLELRAAQVHALVGPNGSGKTTALRLLSGALRPDGGTLELQGRPAAGEPAVLVRRGVVRSLQASALLEEHSALENVLVGVAARRRFGGAARGVLATPRARAEQAAAEATARRALELAGLEGRAAVPASQLTSGERRRLALAAAFATGAPVLLLDEPSAGCSREEVGELVAVIRRLAGRGRAVLLVEHDLELVRAVAADATALDAGVVVHRGLVGEVLADERVRRAYLGSAPPAAE